MDRTVLVLERVAASYRQKPVPRAAGVLGLALALGVAAAATLVPADASAQDHRSKPSSGAAAKRETSSRKAQPSRADMDRAKAIAAQLQSDKREELLAAFESVAAGGPAALLAIPAANARIAKGLPPDLAVAAMKSVGAIGDETSAASVAPYLRHREVAVRRAAAKALGHIRGQASAAALATALSDSDAMVRGLAATGLGAIGATSSVDALFAALDHKVPEAAASIGQLCAAAQCERYSSKMGQLSFDVMTSGFDQILFREAADLTDELKLSIIGKIQEVGTAEAHAFLKDVQGRWPATWSKRVKKAIDLAVSSTEGAPGRSGEAQP